MNYKKVHQSRINKIIETQEKYKNNFVARKTALKEIELVKKNPTRKGFSDICVLMIKELNDNKKISFWETLGLDKHRDTYLHKLVKDRNLNLIKRLYKNKCVTKMIKNKYGLTPIDIAQKLNITDIIKFLKSIFITQEIIPNQGNIKKLEGVLSSMFANKDNKNTSTAFSF